MHRIHPSLAAALDHQFFLKDRLLRRIGFGKRAV